MWHITKGYIPPNLRPDVVKLMLSGRGHEDDMVDREEDVCLACVTIGRMSDGVIRKHVLL